MGRGRIPQAKTPRDTRSFTDLEQTPLYTLSAVRPNGERRHDSNRSHAELTLSLNNVFGHCNHAARDLYSANNKKMAVRVFAKNWCFRREFRPGIRP
jgi:hypothetical protein